MLTQPQQYHRNNHHPYQHNHLQRLDTLAYALREGVLTKLDKRGFLANSRFVETRNFRRAKINSAVTASSLSPPRLSIDIL
jgi:hypothetical protein